ncbi:TPA: DUF1648 domain-containing protein [Bacillus cereus]|uniref:DUF1648 domain-containing protein n=1 Tax=Bacillus cereus TaxID=1396 RepID=UPI00065CDB40|nr:DUF5808 domain-containing protein [Bacillus cereus]KMQ23990.1 hypothetical protein TU58_24340 [Bacillus cereus]
MTLIIFLTTIVSITTIEVAIPFLTKKNVVFGVSIPNGYVNDGKLSSYRKRYSFSIFFSSFIFLFLYLLWIINSNPVEKLIALYGTAIQFSILFISMTLYFYYHTKVIKKHKEQRWEEGLKRIKVTDLGIRSQDKMLPWYLYIIPMVVTIGLFSYTSICYNIFPEQIPIHWGANDKPDAFKQKTYFSAIMLPITLLMLQILLLGTNEAIRKSGIKLSATNLNASRNRQLALRKYSSWVMLITNTLITLFFSFLQLTTIHKGLVEDALIFTVPFILLLIILIGIIIFSVKIGTSEKNMKTTSVEGISDFDENQHWKGGLFYFNKSDPSVFVEKRFGIGWTINFANPIGYLIICGPLVVIVLITFLL